jgi:hypothetical protein
MVGFGRLLPFTVELAANDRLMPFRSSPSRSDGEGDRREAVVEGSGLDRRLTASTPPSALRAATSPLLRKGEDLNVRSHPKADLQRSGFNDVDISGDKPGISLWISC